MDDLVKRLRDVQIHTIPLDLDALREEAAAALEAKDAEIARMAMEENRLCAELKAARDTIASLRAALQAGG